MTRIHLVDASPYIFRAYFSIPPSLTNPAGEPVNAVHGFGAFLLKLIGDEAATHIALAFDESLTTSFRNTIYPDYKGRRELPPPELEAQLGWCAAMARALGLWTVSSERYEAEDLLGSLVAPLLAADPDVELVLVSSDKDLAQLVSERVTLFDFARDQRFDPSAVVEKFGVRPVQIADYLALAGDAVDDIPGVPGVGKKTAAALLGHFADVDAIYADLDAVVDLPIRGAKSLRTKLDSHREIALLSKRLATIATDAREVAAVVEAADPIAALRRGERVDSDFEALVATLGFERFATRVRARIP
ncbi:MAG: 5'-3' exonuclease H3TH domain-containing protein [Acidobacteriota bacterium]